ncbi:MAG: peptidoglycan editing factor PgeF [Gammaproteobacteria bacterium]|nr:peptidoglycan editing factor PgeF [Gammaproteobacteria bacterium]
MNVIRPAWPQWRVRACTTTVSGGVSEGAFAGLNLATHVGDDPLCVQENRRRVRAALGLPAEPFWLEQVHGCMVCKAQSGADRPTVADGAVVTQPGVVGAVLTADCLPIVLADRRGQAAAVLHGGWRGLASGIIEAGVSRLDMGPERLMAWLGPAIGAADYEVGEDVRAAFGDAPAGAFVANRRGRYTADLYALARARLQAAGVKAIYGGGRSTWQDPDCFSFRRQSVCGRMATLVWIAG